ncbi:hypothetical protein [Glycomyces salinus]|uniref:hypothetical protein n=1 Tax=Glycomyces salinus TaxID=980294 RepID=UPI0018EA9C30|nr:hypothetical protein [Glycomyces salinus]
MSGGQSADASDEGVKAGARARIPQPDTRQSEPVPQPPSAASETDTSSDSGEGPTTFKDAVGASLRAMEPTARRWAKTLRPPLFWTEGLPAAGESWLYAKKGEWCRPDSPIRTLALIWQVATLPVRVPTFYLHWLTERPSRLAVFLVVYALLASTSYASWLPWLW